MRADLHVHSYFSGYSTTLRLFGSRDCYTDPERLCQDARARGMDLVTITDHNSIDGCLEFLGRHPHAPDFIVGEEIGCLYPGTDLRVHLGALGVNERIHREVASFRDNVLEAIGYLRAAGVVVVLHHPFHFFRRQVPLGRYIGELFPLVDAVEVRNGTMQVDHNGLVEQAVSEFGRRTGRRIATTGGSDAHTRGGIGTTYTEAAASTREEFLAMIRAGGSHAGGKSGNARRLIREIYGVVGAHVAGLAGIGRHSLTGRSRRTGLILAVASLPIQFMPAAVAIGHKAGEAMRIRGLRREWEAEVRAAPHSAGRREEWGRAR
jgi:predicted metal-dependent phosphoesterase TrpH